MARYITRRVLLAVLQVFIAAVGTFFLLHVVPASPVANIVGLNATPSAIRQAMHSLGLNRSIWAQLGSYLSGLVHGNFGNSWITGQSVRSEILEKLPVTLQFVVPAFFFAILIGVSVGLLVATRPGGAADRAVTGYSLFAGSQPDFWWGLMFLFLFFFVFRIFPAPLGIVSPAVTTPPPVTNFILIDSLLAGDYSAFFSALAHLALPVITLTFVLSGPIIKMTKQSAEAVFDSEYILYAKASGMPDRTVRRRMLSVAITPVLALTGILFGFMLGGAVLIETVFSLDGIGRFALSSTIGLDFPAIQGTVVVLTVLALAVYVVIDVLHALLDPRMTLR